MSFLMPITGPILGIEGTAWNLSAAVFGDELITQHASAYEPLQGGIHPREAAQHHATMMKEVIGKVLKETDRIAGVAFSRGPGLGPCLRTVGTASRALALAFNVPLIGVNHCIAHIEIGRWATGCRDPITLYVSGANTQVLGFLHSRYRIFGETLDIGLGNALDKFARYKGLPHPGGPIVEELALKGSYLELPYTVKGMDLAFSGLVSAAKDSHASLEDVCFSLQENAFAMCVEVTERALAHAEKEEVLLVGGVGVNGRLQEMLRIMCEDREATFHVPPKKYLSDNGAMIAYTGRLMLESGQTIPIEESRINPGYRADEVDVTWRKNSQVSPRTLEKTEARGAEAIVTLGKEIVDKHRIGKRYRRPELDQRLIFERTRAEARLIATARKAGVPTPIIQDVTPDIIIMERVHGALLKDELHPEYLRAAGETVGKLHSAGIIHGDLTTSNMILRDERCVLIDFGLAQVSTELEARGVDLHVLFQTLKSTTPDYKILREAFIEGYQENFPLFEEVLKREHEIERRGRYL
ncbi:MAG: bifunctional N(6)-L-threonylcarbamoyladenine synthase/serine/threonine protein kinase [Methanomicrobiales archaeon]|nr:bifunctional N(6)-L-threonylcarbamoyladenine synthase/serine/threonine protein kinase [Methanomicrobiales archaeon]